MKVTQFAIDQPSLDFTMAQGAAGGTVEAQYFQIKSQVEEPLNALHAKVSAVRPEIEKSRVEAEFIPAEANDTEVVVSDVLTTAGSSIEEGKKQVEQSVQNCTGYRLRNGISDCPNIPDTVKSIIILGSYCVIETMVNAGFLNNAYMVAGPVEAMMSAGLISLTNVAVSTAAGYFILRWLFWGLHSAEPNLPEFKWKRIMAWAAFSGFIAMIFLFHLTVGLVRAQESLHHIEHSIPRYFEILTTPESLFLVMFGLVLSCLSLKKGMVAFDDPYPGYGDKQRIIDRHKKQLAAAGHGVRQVPAAGLDQFVNFDHYRISHSPVFLAMPDFSKTQVDLNKAEAAALQRLSIMFERTMQPNSGG